MSQVKGFFKGVSAELKKITWPTEKEMKTYTVQVMCFVIVLSVFFFAVDLVISQVIGLVEKRWYVVQTYAGYENKVMTNLLKRIETMNMQEKIFRVLIPEEKEVKIKDGVRKEKLKKTFPGYVLVEMIDTDDSWYMVRNTPGVTGFLGSSGKGTRPVPLPTEEITPILKKMGITSVEVSVDIEVGQQVLVAAGPFSGQVGKIETIDKEHGKVSVLVDLFGRETPVELDFGQICEVE